MVPPVGTRALEARIVQELAEGHNEVAFRLADRRCRILPSPQPHCYVLRAEALDRMGQRALALRDLRRALVQSPGYGPACRRMLAWGFGPERSAAALALVRHAADPLIQRQAHGHLQSEGERRLAFVQVLHKRIVGWAVWDGDEPVEVTVTDGQNRVFWRLEADPAHPAAGRAGASNFDLPRPPCSRVQTVTVTLHNQVIASVRAAPSRPGPKPDLRTIATPVQGVTVIVPIHSDFDATRACLDSLTAVLRASPVHRAILVDDAGPDARLRAHVRALDGKDGFRVLHNEQNLGFVGAINRALDHTPDGDVILLNADTVVPIGFIDRLARASRSLPGIGTVTPLSNNGEFTSFPIPNTSNPLPGPSTIAAVDEIAARSNDGRVVDLPSGIGFCLYVTRPCLEATGGLSEDYHRGYLEDADFCLRARERGFRNVCAPSVFVGHAGSRSFAGDKRALVVRNLDILERRFPTHRSECAAFMLADPLRSARDLIERSISPSLTRPRLLLASAGVVSEIARARARRLRQRAVPSLVIEVEARPRAAARIHNPVGGVPQSLAFDLAEAREREAFGRYCDRLGASRIEIFDLPALLPAILSYLRGSGLRFDLFVADATLLHLFRPKGARNAQQWLADLQAAPRTSPDVVESLEPAIADLIETAGEILLPDRDAAALLSGERRQAKCRKAFSERPARTPNRSFVGPAHLGIVPITRSLRERRIIGFVAEGLRRLRPDIVMTVLGSLPDDEALMRSASLVVTGELAETDLDGVIESHGIEGILIALDRPLFGHPRVEAVRRCGMPTAYADWANGQVRPNEGDLPLDPTWAPERTLHCLASWLGHSTGNGLADAQRR